MPKKKPDSAPTQPSVPSPESSSLSFTIETFDDPETGQPTHYGRFNRHWQDEEALLPLLGHDRSPRGYMPGRTSQT